MQGVKKQITFTLYGFPQGQGRQLTETTEL